MDATNPGRMTLIHVEYESIIGKPPTSGHEKNRNDDFLIADETRAI